MRLSAALLFDYFYLDSGSGISKGMKILTIFPVKMENAADMDMNTSRRWQLIPDGNMNM